MNNNIIIDRVCCATEQTLISVFLNFFFKSLFLYLGIGTSVGSNPKITNFELLRTLEVELRTLPNPGSPTKTELRTHPNPPKIPNSEPTNPTTINILEKNDKIIWSPGFAEP